MQETEWKSAPTKRKILVNSIEPRPSTNTLMNGEVQKCTSDKKVISGNVQIFWIHTICRRNIRQESPPIGGAVQNATTHIRAKLQIDKYLLSFVPTRKANKL